MRSWDQGQSNIIILVPDPFDDAKGLEEKHWKSRVLADAGCLNSPGQGSSCVTHMYSSQFCRPEAQGHSVAHFYLVRAASASGCPVYSHGEGIEGYWGPFIRALIPS